MVAAIFRQNAMGIEEHFIEGETAADLLYEFENYQDLGCLSRMGRSMGTKQDIVELAKLDDLLDKRSAGELTIEDLRDFSLNLSIGSLDIVDVATNDEEVERLRK